MFRRPFIRKALLYTLSMFLFWNAIVAIRAYRFTHFQTHHKQINSSEAGMFSYLSKRFTGQEYYKNPIVYNPTLPFTITYLTTTNNLKLEAWRLETNNSKGTVLLFHGLNCNKERMLSEAYAFNKMGYNTFLLDFRAHGNSEGSACTLGLDEADDVKLAYDYIKNKGEQNIILFGASMGAASISHCVEKYNIEPNKIILEMPFASYSQLIEKWFNTSKYPTEPTATLFTFWASAFNGKWFFDMKPSNYVKSIKCPVLLQWGANDKLVPETATTKIYNNITAPKELKIYKNSSHESFCTSEPIEWNTTVEKFINN
jgi:uncharacterized protein